MREFKKGDRVKVKSFNAICLISRCVEQSGTVPISKEGIHFPIGMRAYCGTTAIIRSTDGKHHRLAPDERAPAYPYSFSEDWLIHEGNVVHKILDEGLFTI